MQNQEKIKEIETLLGDLMAANRIYSDEKIGTHFDYDKVLNLLQEANETMNSTARNPRPADLPKDTPWSEKFYDSEQFDPYVYDGSMSTEAYKTMHSHFEADKAAGLVDNHGETITESPQENIKHVTEECKQNPVQKTQPPVML